MGLTNDTPPHVFVIVSSICVGIAAALSYAVDQPLGLAFKFDLTHAAPVWMVGCLAFLINWIAFIPAGILQTEKFFDLTGSITYLALVTYSLVTSAHYSVRELTLSAMTLAWAVRLGSFLVVRVHRAGKDGRFDEMKLYPVRFWNMWTIQGLWVFITALPVFAVNATASDKPLQVQDYVGFGVWGVGWLIEIVADNQKSAFNARNTGKWVDVGLWRYSRHPNYFGEMVLWAGVFLSASSIVTGSQWAVALSPLFVVFLLMKVSGVPLLEARADEKWGGDRAYEKYKAQTSILVPLPPSAVDDSDFTSLNDER